MLKIITFIFSCLLIARISYADTVYLKDGRVYGNAQTQETAQGIWIDGVLFKKNLINKIDKARVVKENPSQKVSWQDRIKSLFTKSPSKKASSSAQQSDIDKRIRERIEREKVRAREQTDDALRRSQQADKKAEDYKLPSYTIPDTKMPDYNSGKKSSSY